ncbi:MAG: hypothetical protein P9L95_06605 [Candidatus Tenebribacter mawsonii]|nr:hypothetical protein [Candidatus Tenebribacter mawsonii]
MKRLISTIIIIFIIIDLSSLTLVLQNNEEIEGNLKCYKDDKIYLAQKRKLYIVETKEIKRIIQEGIEISLDDIPLHKKIFEIGNMAYYREVINIPEPQKIISENFLLQNKECMLLNETGKNLKSFSKWFYFGLGVNMIGTIASLPNEDGKIGSSGPIISLIGLAILAFAPIKVAEAGNNLQKLSQNRYYGLERQYTNNDTIKFIPEKE